MVSEKIHKCLKSQYFLLNLHNNNYLLARDLDDCKTSYCSLFTGF